MIGLLGQAVELFQEVHIIIMLKLWLKVWIHLCTLYWPCIPKCRDLYIQYVMLLHTPYSILQARLYEVVYELYQIIIPVHVAKKQFRELGIIHGKLEDCFQKIVYRVRIHNNMIWQSFNLIAGK